MFYMVLKYKVPIPRTVLLVKITFSERPGRAMSKAQALKEQKTRESEAMENYFKTQVVKAEVEVKTLKLDFNIKALQFAKKYVMVLIYRRPTK